MQEQYSFSTESSINPRDCHLSIQLSTESFSYAIYSPADNQLLQLRRFLLEQCSTKELDRILDQNEILHGNFSRIITSLDFGFNVLLHEGMSQAEATPLMYLENADQQDHTITEFIAERNITNMYSVPPEVLTWTVHHFPSSGYLHAKTVAIKMVKEFPADGLIRIDVQPKKCAIVAFDGSQLLLAKDYKYSTPADMVFYLLKICEAFRLSQEKISLQVSGLVEIESKLFRELYDYFLNISLKKVDWIDNISALPKYYFTSLNELTVCELFQET